MICRCLHFLTRFNNRACYQHSHNSIFHWNFPKYSVKILHAVIDAPRFFRGYMFTYRVSRISEIMHCGILININMIKKMNNIIMIMNVKVISTARGGSSILAEYSRCEVRKRYWEFFV